MKSLEKMIRVARWTLPVLCLALMAIPGTTFASGAATPVSSVQKARPATDVPAYEMPPVNRAKLLFEDEANETKDQPFRYGVNQQAGLTFPWDCLREKLKNGDELWRMTVISPGAYTLSFQLFPFHLPEGAQLFMYTPDKSYVVGPLTAKDNDNRPEGYWTPALPGDTVTFEFYLPENRSFEPKLTLATVIHAYRNSILKIISPGGVVQPDASGSCNVDVECERAQWGDEINSVARYTFGGYLCTGTLITDIPQDCTPYFWTAHHCVSSSHDANTVVTYWNYERSSCGGGTGPSTHTVSGSSLIWTNTASDGTLLQLDAMPDASYTPYLSGWTATNQAPSKSTCIHHPSGDYKKISHENDQVLTSSYLGSTSPGDGTHWHVENWESGTTEGGSSGSGLWDNTTRRIIGQLHGGYASCSNNVDDYFGKFSESWNAGADAYLDPGNTGQLYADGIYPSSCGGCTTPDAPTGLTVTDYCDQVSLSWTGVSSSIDGYLILRKTGTCGGTYTEVGSTTGTTYDDSSATSGNQYSYVVRAYESTCQSADSNCVTATVASSPSAPAAPTVTDDCSGLVVSWSAVTGADSYNVYRRAGGCGNNNYNQVATGITGTSWTDTPMTAGTTYGYYIEAVNTCGTATNGKNACAEATHSLAAPTVDVTPDSTTTVCVGTGIHYLCSVSGGSGTYTYQWTEDGSNINGATSNVYTATYSTPQSHTYNCKVTDTAGCSGTFTDPSSPTGEWTASHTVDVTPDGTTSVCVGTGIHFVCSISGGTGPFTYQWTEDGVNISGATSNVYTANYPTAQSHTYNCKVTDTAGCPGSVIDTSDSTGTWTGPSHTVSVTPDGTSTVCLGSNIIFTAGVSGGTGPFNYQWTEDGGNITGATSSTYIASYASAQSHVYNCKVVDTGECPGDVTDPVSSTGTWQACLPNIVYQSTGTWTEIYGNMDGVLDPGETWDVDVALTNTGLADATNVQASLTATGASFCTGTNTYGSIPISGSVSATFRFVVDTAVTCGDSLSFNVVNKTSSEGTYTDENGTFTHEVGATLPPTTETVSTADFTAPKNLTSTKTLTPDTATPTSASAARAYYTASNFSGWVDSALLRYTSTGDTVSLNLPSGNGVEVMTDVTSFYQSHGPGTYQMEWVIGSKNVNMVSIRLEVDTAGGFSCTPWTGTSCLTVPEVSSDTAHALKAVRNGDNVDIDFQDVGASHYQIYVSNSPNTSSFQVADSNFGKNDCSFNGWTSQSGGMLQVTNYSLESGITGSTNVLYFMISGDNGSGSEGTLGYATGPVERTADATCNK